MEYDFQIHNNMKDFLNTVINHYKEVNYMDRIICMKFYINLNVYIK